MIEPSTSVCPRCRDNEVTRYLPFGTGRCSDPLCWLVRGEPHIHLSCQKCGTVSSEYPVASDLRPELDAVRAARQLGEA